MNNQNQDENLFLDNEYAWSQYRRKIFDSLVDDDLTKRADIKRKELKILIVQEKERKKALLDELREREIRREEIIKKKKPRT